MSELYDSIRLTHLAAAFTNALGIDAPEGAESPCDIVLDRLFAEFGEGGADRVFIYITRTLSRCGCFKNTLSFLRMQYQELKYSFRYSP